MKTVKERLAELDLQLKKWEADYSEYKNHEQQMKYAQEHDTLDQEVVDEIRELLEQVHDSLETEKSAVIRETQLLNREARIDTVLETIHESGP